MNIPTPTHPRLKLWLDLGEALNTAAEAGFRRAHTALRPRRTAGYRTRRPGPDTPMWNVCATLIRQQLKPYGARARLARYLGIPRQRLSDFLAGRRRLPDAELMLRLLHWMSEARAGHDPAI